MSAHATNEHGHGHEHEGGHRSTWFYVAIGIFLAILTFIELGPLFEWFELPVWALLLLSAIKFFFVVAFFMHLWDDAPMFNRVFVAPLLGSVLMVLVLMALFHTFYPSPEQDSFAVQERYWENYGGECSSWLRSHRTNRWYCASPPISGERVAMHLGERPGTADPGAGEELAAFLELDDEGKRQFLMNKGEEVYTNTCAACHQANGQGIPGAFPPVAGAGEFYGDAQNHASIIVHGLSGPITVLGQQYNGAMPPQGNLSDLEIAAVASYERNSWGNDDGFVMPEDVAAIR